MDTDVVPRSRARRKSSTGHARPVSFLAWFTIAGVLIYVVLDVIAQGLPPHYSPVRQAESDLAVGPYGWIMTANFFVRGILSAALLAALTRVLTRSRQASVGVALFGVWTAGAFLLAIFPTDVGRHIHTFRGAVHLTIALIAFVSIPIAETLLSRALTDSPMWRRLGRRSFPFARLCTACFLVLVAGMAVHPIGGLTERIFLASALLWILVVALGMRIPPRSLIGVSR